MWSANYKIHFALCKLLLITSQSLLGISSSKTGKEKKKTTHTDKARHSHLLLRGCGWMLHQHLSLVFCSRVLFLILGVCDNCGNCKNRLTRQMETNLCDLNKEVYRPHGQMDSILFVSKIKNTLRNTDYLYYWNILLLKSWRSLLASQLYFSSDVL